jgi:hypothetical protein
MVVVVVVVCFGVSGDDDVFLGFRRALLFLDLRLGLFRIFSLCSRIWIISRLLFSAPHFFFDISLTNTAKIHLVFFGLFCQLVNASNKNNGKNPIEFRKTRPAITYF